MSLRSGAGWSGPEACTNRIRSASWSKDGAGPFVRWNCPRRSSMHGWRSFGSSMPQVEHGEVPETRAEDNLGSLAMVFACMRSIEEGSVVELPPR
jgi:hypothetical protein